MKPQDRRLATARAYYRLARKYPARAGFFAKHAERLVAEARRHRLDVAAWKGRVAAPGSRAGPSCDDASHDTVP